MTTARPIPHGITARLRLMATSDLHMNLTDYDYFADRPDLTVGLTRTASLITQARAEAADMRALSLLFDNGDALQGTPLGDTARENNTRSHPLMRAFRHLRYDAMGLGNHDFNYGLSVLGTVLRQAPCPVISSNIHKLSLSNPPGFSPYAILDRIVQSNGAEWPIRIGVISVLPPQTLTWDAHLLGGQVSTDDILECARRLVPELQHAECDLIVALAHTGLGEATERANMENAAIPLAGIEGIDAIIAGHTHLRLPGPDHAGFGHVDAQAGLVHGKPMIMPGAAGSHLGIIDLDLTGADSGRWSVSGARTELRPIASRAHQGAVIALAPQDPALSSLLADDHADTLTRIRQPVGRTRHNLHSYFTFIVPDRSLCVVAAAQAAALRPFLSGTKAGDCPLLSAVSPGKFGGRAGPTWFTDVPAGPVLLRNVADLQVFPNDLHAVLLSGAQLIDWLEMSASLFHQITPGSQGATLLNPALPCYHFDVLHGLTYEIDLSRPARYTADGTLTAPENRRICNVRHAGLPPSPDQMFAVALNSYRASGGGHVAALETAQRLCLPPISIRDVLRDYLTGTLPPDPLENAPDPWRFVPMPDTCVSIRTGPGAQKYLSELSGRGINCEGRDDEGFLRLSVPL
ncbi:bifunctional 2',3'-cyclic-nucleotide 2'-phosphodiesterase/3'-nucleotidase [Arenibacterium sp. CAU 1754]